MNRTTFGKGLFLVAIATAALSAPGLATASEKGTIDEGVNWAREYVQARVQERNARAFGAEKAGEIADMRPRIVGGTVAAPDSNPFQVGLLFKGQPDDYNAQYCAGTLVKKKYVVTAAHCSDFLGVQDVQVLTGTQRLDGSGDRRDVVSIVIHPGWNPTTFDNDIAVWELATRATGVPTARLPRRDPAPGRLLLATGWGNTEAFGYPIASMEVRVPLVSRAVCNGPASYDGQVSDNMLCAGLSEGGADTCQGDSGGPLTRKLNGKYKVLIGITSWGYGCADPNFYGVYTRVSNYRSFIDAIIR